MAANVLASSTSSKEVASTFRKLSDDAVLMAVGVHHSVWARRVGEQAAGGGVMVVPFGDGAAIDDGCRIVIASRHWPPGALKSGAE